MKWGQHWKSGKSQVPDLLGQVGLDMDWGLVANLPIRRDYCSLPIETEQGSPWGWKLSLRPREALDLLQQAAAVLQGQVNCDWGEVGEGLGAGLGY